MYRQALATRQRIEAALPAVGYVDEISLCIAAIAAAHEPTSVPAMHRLASEIEVPRGWRMRKHVDEMVLALVFCVHRAMGSRPINTVPAVPGGPSLSTSDKRPTSNGPVITHGLLRHSIDTLLAIFSESPVLAELVSQDVLQCLISQVLVGLLDSLQMAFHNALADLLAAVIQNANFNRLFSALFCMQARAHARARARTHARTQHSSMQNSAPRTRHSCGTLCWSR